MTNQNIDNSFTFIDANNNKFECKNGSITLTIASTSKVNKIGSIKVIHGLLIYCKREKEKEVHHKTNGWTVPVEIYNRIDGLWYKSEDASYKILKSEADKHIEKVYFRDSNKYESKISIPTRFWNVKPLK